MKPPRAFRLRKMHGWSICDACQEWKINNYFYHEGKYWTLCMMDFTDYWENTDELLSDYRGF